MYLISLKLYQKDELIIRKVNFKKGLNIIVDESKEVSEAGNNVGKTTLLRIIDICLGGERKKEIWSDKDTDSESIEVKNYIDSQKVYAILEVAKSFDESAPIHKLKVDLFLNGKRYIDDESFTVRNYQKKLNKLFFDNESKPTFRQLIGKFVRIGSSENSGAILNYLQSTSYSTYSNIYGFLFKFIEHENGEKKLKLEETLKTLLNERKILRKLHNFSDGNDLKERIRLLNISMERLQDTINAILKVDNYDSKMSEIVRLKNKVNTINDQIETLNFKLHKTREILEDESSKEIVDMDVLNELYKDILKLEIAKKSFDELIDFNLKLKSNRIEYYQIKVNQLQSNLSAKKEERNILLQRNKEFLEVISEDNFERFNEASKALLIERERNGEWSRVLEIEVDLSDQIVDLEKDLDKINSEKMEVTFLQSFNEKFTSYASDILKQSLYYVTTESGFPIKIANNTEGLGTGYKKTVAILSDIAYINTAQQLDVPSPYFFIHDVLEMVDKANLRKITKIINESNIQFLFAILEEKIDEYEFVEEKDRVLKLSNQNKLFKV